METIEYNGKKLVHLTNFTPDPVTKGKITRRFKKTKDSYLHYFSSNPCPKHKKGGCNLVPKPIAFLFYLGLLLDTHPKDSQIIFEIEPQQNFELDPPLSFQSVSTIENLDRAEELKEEPIDLALEKKESANLDVALFRAQTVVDEPIEDVPITETSLTLVHLPSFHLNGKDYITLHSIHSLFNIREDYCLVAIAEASQVAKDFMDIEGESKEEFLALDLETSNQKFLEAPDAFEFCLKRVAEEEPAIKDVDFEARLVELGIDKFGRNVVELDKINIELLDEDNFLGRAGGSRAASKYTGHALIHYLSKLDKDIFCAFTSQLSDHLELLIFPSLEQSDEFVFGLNGHINSLLDELLCRLRAKSGVDEAGDEAQSREATLSSRCLHFGNNKRVNRQSHWAPGDLSRSLEGKKASDTRLAAVVVGAFDGVLELLV
ncbi:hypothetical protein L7F22_049101 [Adiantum nelumboides]|nr:hypothetical protein [Adiantum nelumboides]